MDYRSKRTEWMPRRFSVISLEPLCPRAVLVSHFVGNVVKCILVVYTTYFSIPKYSTVRDFLGTVNQF